MNLSAYRSDCPYWAYLGNTGKDPVPRRVCEIWGNDITTVEKGEMCLKYCSIERMLADIMTNPLGAIKFKEPRSAIGLSKF